MKKNIAILSLIRNASNNIALLFCKKTKQMYTNVDDILEFRLGDLENVLEKAGLQYFDEEQTSLIKSVVTYDNVCITCDYNTFSKQSNLKLLKQNCYIVFLKYDLYSYDKYNKDMDKGEFELNKTVFLDRQNVFSTQADMVVDCTTISENKAVSNIIKRLKKENILC